MSENRLSEIKRIYREIFGEKYEIFIAEAPGRANIIGEHTDYNEGFVMPIAISLFTRVAGAKNDTDVVYIYSKNINSLKRFSINDLETSSRESWDGYIKGIIWALKRRNIHVSGFNSVIDSEVPFGGGLSSSAALEVSMVHLINKIFNLKLDPITEIKIAYEAEHDFLGIQCGIMDQFISVLGKEEHALFLDTRSLEFEHVRIDSDIEFVLIDSMVRHKAQDVLNKRKEECLQAIKIINEKTKLHIKALRDLSVDDFERIKDILPKNIKKRVEHVVFENQRVIEAKDAIKKKDWEKVGNLLKAAHESVSKLYEVSIPELDFLVETAYNIEGVIGARLTGAGFGGYTINLVFKDYVSDFISAIIKKYKGEYNKEPNIIITKPAHGVI